jgi:hypothetical protein
MSDFVFDGALGASGSLNNFFSINRNEAWVGVTVIGRKKGIKGNPLVAQEPERLTKATRIHMELR